MAFLMNKQLQVLEMIWSFVEVDLSLMLGFVTAATTAATSQKRSMHSEVTTCLPTYSVSVGTAKKCHCKQNVTVTGIFRVRRSFFWTHKVSLWAECHCNWCHCKRGGLYLNMTVVGSIKSLGPLSVKKGMAELTVWQGNSIECSCKFPVPNEGIARMHYTEWLLKVEFRESIPNGDVLVK